MADIEVDVVVLGWGKGGKTLAGALGRAGRSVAVVERSAQMYGGSCININCVPTKALVHQAEGRPDGVDAQDWFSAAIGQRDDLVAKLRARNHAMLAEVDAVTLIDGHARFIGPHQVEVQAGDDRLVIDAETVVVNTGTIPAAPDIEGAAGSSCVYDSTTLQHVEPLPRRLVVVGGGYVGLEFAGMFAHFGSQVTLVDHHDELMPGEDRDVADAVRSLLADQGVEFILGGAIGSVRDEGGASARVVVAPSESADATELDADAVLLATGRRPATTDLGLDVAGISTDDRGYVVVDERLRTSVSGVFAIGDVSGGPQFTYVSLDDYRIVLDQLTGGGTRTTTDRVAVPSTTFLTPPLARVGLNESQARAQGHDFLVATKRVADIAAMPRPKIVGETHGLVKVIADARTDQILGATLFCVDAQEVINLVSLAMRTGTTATQLRDSMWTHPSSTEALNEVLAGLQPSG
ncbi:FAD-dependent oxidoreductase [Solicola gregarius]|uniref:FAD-dependent oxidoreductase n=1 Tax=Solicola gregarius TaxID=2908642 RepID=A0AA46TLW9_9ACTN|nr:FAD-dependent oxidoreductase [Solicola gregarius]UYM07717.1 FAD-dependent oxidoreductase [Solicola gregarius]